MKANYSLLAMAVLAVGAVGLSGVAAWRATLGAEFSRETPRAADYAATASAAGGTQLNALSDGTVTLEEYNAAVDATASCVRAAGVDASVQAGAGLKPASVVLPPAASLAEADRARAIWTDCEKEHAEAVQTTWALQQGERTAAQFEEAHRLLSRCIQERGAVLSDGFLSVDDLNVLMTSAGSHSEQDAKVFEAYRACRESVTEQTGHRLP